MKMTKKSNQWGPVRLDSIQASSKYSFVGGPFGSNLTSSDYVDSPGVPVIRGTNLGATEGRFIDEGFVFVSEDKAGELSQNLAFPGDVVFTQRGTLGQVAIIPENACFSKYVISQSQMKLTVDSEKADRRYVYYAFRSPLSQLRLLSRTQATGVPHINLGILRAFEIPLPPLSEQKRIADILDKADAIRRKRWSALASIEEVIQSTFMQTVGPAADGFLSWPVKEIHELVASHKGAMRTGPFGSTLKHSEFVDSGVAVLGIDNAVKNRFAWDQRRFISPEKYEDLRVYTVHPGDVLITIMATTGRSAVVPDDIPLAINTKHLACITLDRRMAEPEFISQAIHRHPVVLTQLGASGRGAIMNGLNLGIIKQIKIPTPPIELQREFASSVARLRLLESRLQAASNEGENLFNSLVQRAFKGEL